MTIKEIKSLDYYFYYFNGRLIKTNQKYNQLPLELFENNAKKMNLSLQVFVDCDVYRLDVTNKSTGEYNGVYKPEICSLLEQFDYVSCNYTKDQFVGYSDLSKDRLNKVSDVTFLASISTEQKLEILNKLFKKYNLEMLNENSSLKSIPIPSVLLDDLLVAETSKEIRLQHYFKSLEYHLNEYCENERWIVVDSFDLLNQKFVDYFSTEPMDQAEGEKVIIDLCKENLPDDLKESIFVYASNALGYSGYLKRADSTKLTSINFGITKSNLKKKLCKEFIARYIQNSQILPIHKESISAESIDIFSLKYLQENGIFLFCFTIRKEE